MIKTSDFIDEKLKRRFMLFAKNDRDYWSFKGSSKREYGHGLFQYPAMMVPQLVNTIIEEVSKVHPEIEAVCDPFAGSGTVLTESMFRGMNFLGKDINPLAVLLCRAKAGPFFTATLIPKVVELYARIEKDRKTRIEVDFPGIEKWFETDVQVYLSKIRRSITAETELWARRFFWIAIAETVRFTSNSRTSTFKLHIRPTDEIEERNIDPVAIFKKTISRNIDHLKSQEEYLEKQGYLNKGRYKGEVKVTLGNAKDILTEEQGVYDIIFTSPPYGDNVTTVPYGQYAYLPLQWIDITDIDSSASTEYLYSTHEIDARSLGGKKRLDKQDNDSLCDRSDSFKSYLGCLKNKPIDYSRRVTAFFRDLDRCLDSVLGYLRPAGLMFWILGNRKVGGKRVPMDQIVTDLLLAHNAKPLFTLKRHILSKRMACKNNFAETMSNETILVMRKAM